MADRLVPVSVVSEELDATSKVKLRLHYRGAFKQDAAQQWRYVGGEVYNESVPSWYRYADVSKKLNDKFGNTVSFKYLAPGDEVDPESLIQVLDDDDLQELYDEYKAALRRPGTPLKTFRVKVYVFLAVQYEYENDWENDEDMVDIDYYEQSMGTSMCGPQEMDFNDYASDVEVEGEVTESSNLSAMPSSDTEVHMPGQLLIPTRLAPTFSNVERMAMNNINKGVSLQLNHNSQHGQYAPVMQYAYTQAETAEQVQQDLYSMVQLDNGAAYGELDDPYSEQEADDGNGYSTGHNGAKQGWADKELDRVAAAAGTQQQHLQRPGGSPVVQLLQQQPGVRNAQDDACNNIKNLPSHISAFGDNSEDGEAAGHRNGAFNLPSHISAFGEGTASYGAVEDGNVHMHITPRAPGGLHRLANGAIHQGAGWPPALSDDAGIKVQGSKCITQEFTQDASVVGLPNGLGQLDFSQHVAGLDCPPELSPTGSALMGVAKLRRDEVHIIAKIGEGAFGEVSQARHSIYGVVAVKWLKRDRMAKYSESFHREAETLARFNHPNIIRMYGLIMEADPAHGPGAPQLVGGIVTEFVRNGSLTQLLRNMSHRISLRQRCHIAMQATLGMAYLHAQEPAVVHFDLKPDNLLVDGDGDCMVIKVADFGLSKHKFNSHVSCRDLRGTLPYMAPELVSHPNQVSEKCDVWSMGVVMWEMFTLEVPFADLTAQNILMGLMHGNLHLTIPPSCDPEWRSLIESCMDPNPSSRPSFQELALQLQEIMRQEEARMASEGACSRSRTSGSAGSSYAY